MRTFCLPLKVVGMNQHEDDGIKRNSPLAGGDQRVLNRFVRNPGFFGTDPNLRYGVLPFEMMTQVIEHHLRVQGGGMYYDPNDFVMYHANKGGHYDSTKVLSGRSMCANYDSSWYDLAPHVAA